ncbi:Hypothetical protein FKW44_009230 [Caligus rogercresseyi]|uniref:Uncharacterized protein n=1 Tax=Caligus rogercresseyi TaxID=217165 RepID=A0A7T8HF79_CALRO|nr:Hypothetical protein FKW44_009230 [Caligus rogercresseyi]
MDLGSAKPNRGVLGLHIPRQWPLGSAKPNRGVLGLQIPRQWALGFRRTQLLYFRVTNPLPMDPRVLPNTTRSVLGYKSPPMGHWIPPNTLGVFWGYKSPRQWASRSD